VILHGSLTLGDYVPGRSDIDLLLVVEDSPTDAQSVILEAAFADEAQSAPGRVDFRMVTRDVAAAPTPAPPLELAIARSADGELAVERHLAHERDLVVEFSMCRAHGRSLAGAPPAEVLAEVPDEWLLDVGDDQLASWQALEYSPRHAELMVFTACRVWLFAKERRHSSKTAAGEWALRCDPTLHVVRDALHRRHANRSTALEEAPVRELLAAARTHVAQARRRHGS